MKRIIFVSRTWSKIIKWRVGDYFVKRSFRKKIRIIFLSEKIGSKKDLSKKVGGKATVRLSWRKGKWVMTSTGMRREDEKEKEKQAARGKLDQKKIREYRKEFLIYRI
jgi:hypothetical protein